ncbi:unnamed protein product [Soboliphyme baturini]|uniref:DHC_N2 domain-containing protein n=1 Tax=Soboliphyme baturini TaxID=241478 RepID=A0A183ILL3_9BILA|nr:unnamed protein product [Soboliphyme baturini]
MQTTTESSSETTDHYVDAPEPITDSSSNDWSTVVWKLESALNMLFSNVSTVTSVPFAEILESSNTWLDYASSLVEHECIDVEALHKNPSPVINQVKEKLEFVKQYQSRVDMLQNRFEESLKTVTSDGHVDPNFQKNFDLFIEKWSGLVEKITAAVEMLSNFIETTPTPHLEEALRSLSEWLSCAEDVIATQDLDSIDKLDNLQNEMGIQHENLNFIISAADDFIGEHPENFIRFSEELVNIVPRWNDIEQVLNNQLTRLENGFAKLQDWSMCAVELEKWMNQVTQFIHSEKAAMGNIETLRKQLEQSQGLINDTVVLEAKMKQMETCSNELKSICKPSVKEYVSNRMEEIDARWADVLRLIKAKHSR